MKGNPLLRLAIVLLVLAAVLWPVYHLTMRQATPASLEQITDSPETIASDRPTTASATTTAATSSLSLKLSSEKRPTLRATLLVHAAPSPQHLLITQLGRRLLTEKDQISPGEYRTAIEITKGEDLLISGDWDNEEPHALRIEVLVHGYQAPLEKSFWGQKTIEDTLPIPESFLP